MTLEYSDLLLIILYFSLSLGLGLCYSLVKKRTAKSPNLEDYFLSGRQLPWWLAGTSMVATTFAADTPLWVAGKVGNYGISGNWLWWSMAAGGLLTVFFFARLWRRAEVLTDLELIELRYSGKPAAFLRGFRGLYVGIGLNCIVISWVNLALLRICEGLLPEYNSKLIVIGCVAITLVYVSVSGLWGIALVDAFQFLVALGSCALLAFFAWNHSSIIERGGINQILGDSFLSFFPKLGVSPDISQPLTEPAYEETPPSSGLALPWSAFLAYVLLLWWASWYPGSEPGGGGYISQRILSSRNEKEGMLASLWFVIAHYCVRSWPWIVAALAAAVLYPQLQGDDKESGFVYLMRDILPSPAKGLLIAAFFGAYMSTLSTHLNWGASYAVNDFYKRFLVREKQDRHYIFIARLVGLILSIASLLICFYLLDSIRQAWSFLIDCTAGMGFVLILRWYWWRINAWAELTAMLAPMLVVFMLRLVLPAFFAYSPPAAPQSLFIIVPISIAITLLVIYLTPKENTEHLKKFYAKIQPLGPGWFPITKQNKAGLGILFLCWLLALILVYSLLFLVGYLILGHPNLSWLCASIASISGLTLSFLLRKKTVN